MCGVAIGILYLEETHEEMKDRRDIGLELGKWILSRCRRQRRQKAEFSKAGEANLHESELLLEGDEQPPGYRSTEGSPRPTTSRVPFAGSPRRPNPAKRDAPGKKKPSLSEAFSKQVVLNIIGYGILA